MSELAWCLLTDAALKEELDAVWTADVEVVSDNLLEEFATVKRAVEDLGKCKAHFQLEDGELVGVAGLSIAARERMGQAAQPASKEAVNVLSTEAVANRKARTKRT